MSKTKTKLSIRAFECFLESTKIKSNILISYLTTGIYVIQSNSQILT